MFNAITNALSPRTTRSTSEDRSPQEAETVPSGCWPARRLSRQEVPYVRMRTYGTMDTSGDKPLAQRAVRTPEKAAKPVAKKECIREILKSRKLSLKLMLDPPPSGNIISYKGVERNSFYCLEPGSKHQAYYLGENDGGLRSIKLPLQPAKHTPRCFLAPCRPGDLIGIEVNADHIRVFMDKMVPEELLHDPAATPWRIADQATVFVPASTAYKRKIPVSWWSYKNYSDDMVRKGLDVILWGQFEFVTDNIGTQWRFGLQHNSSLGTNHRDIVKVACSKYNSVGRNHIELPEQALETTVGANQAVEIPCPDLPL